MIRRPVRKLDQSQRAIVAALEALGCRVIDLSMVGGGCPDLIVCRPTREASGHAETLLMECKTPKTQRGKKWELTPAQEKLHARWKGRIVTVETVDEALAAVGARR